MKTLIAFEHPDDTEFSERPIAFLEKRVAFPVTVRLATADDIPADLAAKALGLTIDFLQWAAEEEYPDLDDLEAQITRDGCEEAALRVREAQEKRGHS